MLLGGVGGCAREATQLLLQLTGNLDDPTDGSPGIDGVRVRVLQLLEEPGAVRGDPACDVDGATVSRNGYRYVQRLCRDYSLGPGGDLELLEDLRLGVLPFPAGAMPDAGVIRVGLEVIGLSGGEEQIRVLAHRQFEVGRRIDVTLTLSSPCTGDPCPIVGQTCRNLRQCVDPSE